MRGRFSREATDTFKKAAGLRDEIAFPYVSELVMKYWNSLVDMRSATVEGTTIEWLTTTFITATVEWSWGVNMKAGEGGGTAIGLRTVSSCWRAVCNTEWLDFTIASTGRPSSGDYVVDNRPNSWTLGRWIQARAGEDDSRLKNCLMRLKQEFDDWELSCQTHPVSREVQGYSWAIDSLRACRLAKEAGWTNDILSLDASSSMGLGSSSPY